MPVEVAEVLTRNRLRRYGEKDLNGELVRALHALGTAELLGAVQCAGDVGREYRDGLPFGF